MELGILYGISVGSGDPELITVKGLRILQTSPVVAFPAGTNNCPGIAENIISSWLLPQQKILPLEFPYVQDIARLQIAWQKTAQQVWHYLNQGVNVAFACLGDISFYSTFTYLAQTLQQLHPKAKVETVPGVCSPMAIASVLKIPLVVNHQKLAILPAIHTISEIEATLEWAEVVILLKVSSVYQQVWQILKERNLLNSSWIVEKATFPEQKIYDDLSNCPELNLSYFSILLIKQ
ncbi:precorrin-2 C(20)-methyltransferase [Pleurocapsa sp. PCC 7319]|uniref:precorrin-2 C(20)-methyltransferase n=1 Tax=Pleurocapsa sp. PCC 7319 TaxID=118161 RepID=UPI00034ABFE4|nr:precorrin-2 C(20)-methyltransferase [Pleurocapsa sp. PCC 7319]